MFFCRVSIIEGHLLILSPIDLDAITEEYFIDEGWKTLRFSNLAL
jgi:hypothetical protein